MHKQVFIVSILLTAWLFIPNTGYSQMSEMDFTGLDVFWEMVDKLKTDREPNAEEWAELKQLRFLQSQLKS